MESERRVWAAMDTAAWGDRFRWLGLTPLERPDLGLAQAFMRQEAAVAVSVGRDASVWADLFNDIRALRSCRGLGLAIPDHVQMAALELPAAIEFVILGEGAGVPEAWHALPVIAQVTSVEQAELALQRQVHGLIAKGQDSGGWVGQESSFILLQRLLSLPGRGDIPVWAQGGIGLQTAAAAIAGGASGVILDAALTLLPECRWHSTWRPQLTAMDGSEVRDMAGCQLYVRTPGDVALLETMSVDQIRQGLAEERCLPLGQDANLALSVSEACGHVEVLLQTLRLNVPAQIEQAVELNLLGEHSPWARSHGVQWAIAQGPMTRVSDTPEFCEAVASAGGLPFLVFSLMKEEACRQLLVATQERMQGRPFGVGVLGFADPQLLQAQLDLIKTYRPAAVLLAGGRPAQARGLMEQGIAAYLHVPSPGLLRLFLEEGATHFVFEGRECGGHVGPRYSFVLWQQMISLLLKAEQPQRLHILFAGGIHDARSAAMVAAMAAPLAAQGIRVGILMGSAYLATHEAVQCAAIVEHCQQRLLDATSTVLVESAPGHAIRCLPSGFVDHFRQEKLRLQREGVDPRTAGSLLETMTVGRLRIATKALDYQEGHLVAVDEKIQDDQGMFMIGQNIVMKKHVQSIAQLHADVSLGAMQHLRAVNLPKTKFKLPRLMLRRSPRQEHKHNRPRRDSRGSAERKQSS